MSVSNKGQPVPLVFDQHGQILHGFIAGGDQRFPHPFTTTRQFCCNHFKMIGNKRQQELVRVTIAPGMVQYEKLWFHVVYAFAKTVWCMVSLSSINWPYSILYSLSA